jgi:NAD(P)H-nitrite reductase large subunit
MNSMPLLGLPVISAGISDEREGVRVKTIYNPEKNSYLKFYLRDNNLAGYLLVNDIDRAGIYTDLIRNKADISTFEDSLGEIDFGLISLPKEIRKEKMLK